MLLINEVRSPANTPDGRVILHLYSLGQDAPYEVSLTRKSASGAVLSLLWAIGNLPDPTKDSGEIPISVKGQAHMTVGDRSATLHLSMNGLGVALELSRPELVSLQAQIGATLEALTG